MVNFNLKLLAIILAFLAPVYVSAAPDDGLKILIIRHAEKPAKGDNLSCQGENRALEVGSMIAKTFGKPSKIYVPTPKSGEATKRARMFETASPIATRFDVSINSKYSIADFPNITKSVLMEKGLVLMVWQHENIPPLAKALGVKNPPAWIKTDYDSIWVVSFKKGKATLTIGKEGLNPQANCPF